MNRLGLLQYHNRRPNDLLNLTSCLKTTPLPCHTALRVNELGRVNEEALESTQRVYDRYVSILADIDDVLV